MLALCLLVVFFYDTGYTSLPPTGKRYDTAKASIETLRLDAKRANLREPWEKLAAEFRAIYDADPGWPNRPAALFRAAESLEELARRSFAKADARKAIARAQRLDPLNAVVFRNAGVIEYSARDYAACQAPLRSALTINPDLAGVHLVLGDVHLLAGRAAEAKAEYLQERNSLSRQRGLAIADLRLGDRPAAEAGLAAMIAEYGDNSLYQQAQVHAQWGQIEAALAALEKALSAGDSGLVQSRNDPLLDPLRREPGFTAILRQLGFETPGSPAGN